MVVAKRYIYVKEFQGLPKIENVQLVEETLPELNDGEFLVEAVYLSVDPFNVIYDKKLGETMIGTQVAKILESKSAKFPVGKYVVGGFGWTTHSIVKDDIPLTTWTVPTLVSFEPSDKLPASLALGMLGMPGNTAYFGFMEVSKTKPGDVLVISGAAGAIGSHVGQLAKLHGCTVIGICGSDEKGKWLKSIGFDHVINYKTDNIRKVLYEIAPTGIDSYFDNIGGEISEIMLDKMKEGGTVAVCGATSIYTEKDPIKKIFATIKKWQMDNPRGLNIQFFMIDNYIQRWDESVEQNAKWIEEGKLVVKETITEGFENMMKALQGVMTGENYGKAIVKI